MFLEGKKHSHLFAAFIFVAVVILSTLTDTRDCDGRARIMEGLKSIEAADIERIVFYRESPNNPDGKYAAAEKEITDPLELDYFVRCFDASVWWMPSHPTFRQGGYHNIGIHLKSGGIHLFSFALLADLGKEYDPIVYCDEEEDAFASHDDDYVLIYYRGEKDHRLRYSMKMQNTLLYDWLIEFRP